jgi:ubiquinol-cytochrome c reductase cytochrome b subunit
VQRNKVALGVFVVSFITLGWLGMEPVTKTNSILARVFTVTYFGFFILMPWFTSIGKTSRKALSTKVVQYVRGFLVGWLQ